MVENALRNDLDPYAYLLDVLKRLPKMTNQDDLRPLLPKNWRKPSDPDTLAGPERP